MTYQKKIISRRRLKNVVASLKRQGKKIAFTNGCFDILHAGHVSYLQRAKRPGRVLIVGLNSDVSVRAIKGPRRPIVGQKERALVLAALACVDFVTIFNETTPEALIRSVKPNILIKGADWKDKEVVGGSFVRSYGGRVELMRYLGRHSTSNIIFGNARRW